MVSQFTAKVSRGQIVIRDVDLPEGTAVRVTVQPDTAPALFSAEVERDIRASVGEADRGETISGEEHLVRIRRFQTLLDQGHTPSSASRGTRRGAVATSSRQRPKPAARRAR